MLGSGAQERDNDEHDGAEEHDERSDDPDPASALGVVGLPVEHGETEQRHGSAGEGQIEPPGDQRAHGEKSGEGDEEDGFGGIDRSRWDRAQGLIQPLLHLEHLLLELQIFRVLVREAVPEFAHGESVPQSQGLGLGDGLAVGRAIFSETAQGAEVQLVGDNVSESRGQHLKSTHPIRRQLDPGRVVLGRRENEVHVRMIGARAVIASQDEGHGKSVPQSHVGWGRGG